MVLFCVCPYTAVHLHPKCIKFGKSCLSQQDSRKRDWNAACCVYTEVMQLRQWRTQGRLNAPDLRQRK